MKLVSFKTHVNRGPILIGHSDIQNKVSFLIYLKTLAKTLDVINQNISTSVRQQIISSMGHET